MVTSNKNSALSLDIKSIDELSALWYTYIIKERKTKAAKVVGSTERESKNTR